MIKCALDPDGCINLLAVMRIMNQVDQEQVWAIAYELAALMQRLWPAGNCAPVESLAQVFVHRDGHVHEKSLLALPAGVEAGLQAASAPGPLPAGAAAAAAPPAAPVITTTTSTTNVTTNARAKSPPAAQQDLTAAPPEASPHQARRNRPQQLPPSPPITPELELARRRPALSESELVASLGLALFWALDYGIPDDEERKLSMTMEYLIFKSQAELTLDEVLDICIKRLPAATKTNADLHYRQVCKSLIGDTVELSIFLDRIYKATMELSGMADPARRHSSGPDGLVDDCCLVAAAAAAERRHHSPPEEKKGKDYCDSDLLGRHHHHPHLHHHSHSHHHHHSDHHLGLPLASLRALKIDEWARLWMQVIKEMRQRNKFKHLGVAQELNCPSVLG